MDLLNIRESKEARKQGSKEARKQGSKEARKQGRSQRKPWFPLYKDNSINYAQIRT